MRTNTHEYFFTCEVRSQWLEYVMDEIFVVSELAEYVSERLDGESVLNVVVGAQHEREEAQVELFAQSHTGWDSGDALDKETWE